MIKTETWELTASLQVKSDVGAVKTLLRDSGGSGVFPLFLDQTEAWRAEKIFLETTPDYLRVWIPHPPPPRHLSWGLDSALRDTFIVWTPV